MSDTSKPTSPSHGQPSKDAQELSAQELEQVAGGIAPPLPLSSSDKDLILKKGSMTSAPPDWDK